MGWEAWFTAGLIVTMLGVLATGRFGTDIIMLGVLAVLLVTRIIKPDEAFKGFANTGLLTVAFLYIVATGLQETGGMNLLTGRLLGRPKSALEAQARMMVPVMAMSAFMNNTPLVAMFMPVIRELSRRSRIPASCLFMPLSFAAILGGVCTLIGTSTNLVVFAMIEGYNAEHKDSPVTQMGMWTISLVGVPVAIVGTAYMLAFGRLLLPSAPKEEAAGDESREYMTAMRVEPGSAAAGRTIEQAGLRHLPGLFLSRIDRAGETVTAVAPDETLQASDVLVFVGNLESVVDLQKIKGLCPISDEAGPLHYRPKMKLIEAVISASSPLVGRTIRDAEIRTRYGAVVIAVHRLGQRLGGRLGDIVLRSGDNLLLEAEPGFTRRHRNSKAFYLVNELEGAATLRHDRAWVSLAILVGLVLIMSFSDVWPIRDLPLFGGMPEVVAALCAACAMILLRCCTGPQARAGVEWPVLIVIGCSFGLGKAMENTGLAATIAGNLTAWAGPYGPWALIGTVYMITLAFTTLISNNAAAALMFPIALGISKAAGYEFMPFAICIALAASCEFMTPLGYQTNLMVMGPGGYKWKDFMRFGGPLTLLAAITSIALLPLVFRLHAD